MKQDKTELNIDFIGGKEPLTKSEEKAISEYIKKQKAKRGKKEINGKARSSLKGKLNKKATL